MVAPATGAATVDAASEVGGRSARLAGICAPNLSGDGGWGQECPPGAHGSPPPHRRDAVPEPPIWSEPGSLGADGNPRVRTTPRAPGRGCVRPGITERAPPRGDRPAPSHIRRP